MSVVRSRKQATGNFGENAAAAYLQKQGMKIVSRNWRSGPHELDIICLQNDTLVFAEVKTRAAGGRETPAEALHRGKRKSLLRAAGEYLNKNNLWEMPCRFDLVSVVTGEAGQCQVEHIENVFNFDETSAGSGWKALDCGHTPWQPW